MDLQYAREAFERYLEQYDQRDDKVRLKIVHTYGVVETSRQITERMGLCPEDIDLAQLIGLLHDIGRFEQIKRFGSFEPSTMNLSLIHIYLGNLLWAVYQRDAGTGRIKPPVCG